MTDRDPRRDPIPGDEIQNWKGIQRSVVVPLCPSEGIVLYRNSRSVWVSNCSLATWRQWAKGAKVLKRGDE